MTEKLPGTSQQGSGCGMAALPPGSAHLCRTNLNVVFVFSLDSNTQFLTRSSGRGWLLRRAYKGVCVWRVRNHCYKNSLWASLVAQ